jgi:uncharacterized protein (DUF849 family)/3-hydroxyacyl-CoA dehydrogenase
MNQQNQQNRNVAIVGVGLVGRAWAAIFARAGWNVRLTDPHIPTLSAAPRLIRDELHALARHGLAEDPDGTVARVSIAASLADALHGVEFVQESGPEMVEEKRTIFAQLDRLAPPDALLVSSTSAITASRFTETLPGRARCLVGHPVNPPHLVPLVELCGAPWTAPESIERARNIYREIGQVPVTINREINGFVLNRLQGALLAEAFRLVGEGYISAEDLDHTVKDGLGLRWSFLGPFETIELNAPGGIPDYCARYTGFYKELASTAAGPEVYQSPNVDRVIAAWPHQPTPERIAALTQRRNERLAALAAHKTRQTSKPWPLQPATKKEKNMSRKVIITCAVTGAIHTPSMSKALPITPQEIADAAVDAAEAGAAIVHLHARNPKTGQPDQSPEAFAPFLKIIKQRSNAVINLTTGGSPTMTVDERVRPAAVYKPEIASLNMGSMNFAFFGMLNRFKKFEHDWELKHLQNKDIVFRNTFQDIEYVLNTLAETNTRFEFECYDTAHLYNLNYFLERGLVKPPLFIQTVFGLQGGTGAHPEDVLHMKRTADRLFGDKMVWSVLGAGRNQLPIAAMAAAMGGNVRVGLEDSLWAAPGRMATSNAEQVTLARKIIEGLGLEIATADEAREILQLKGGDKLEV